MTQSDVPTGLASTAGALARQHVLSDQKPDVISSLAGISAVSQWLTRANAALPGEPTADKATEWLFDNAYLVERAIGQIRKDLPSGYYKRLRALVLEDGSRPPRVYALAQAIVHATHLQLTQESITRFVSAYQKADQLDLAELWALPTMLRLSCIEGLVSSLERLAPELKIPFPIPRFEGVPLRLSDTECVARSLRGLATLSSIPWADFVEATSAIESILRRDPAAAYRKMDAETRDGYRRAVEDLAGRSHHDETEIARRVLARARHAPDQNRGRHVGFWLVAEGREQLERSLLYRPTLFSKLQRGLLRHATRAYLSALFVLVCLFALVPAFYLALFEPPLVTWAAALVLFMLPASMLSVTVVHWTISKILPPTVLPKLAFERDIPPEFKTAVVIPSLLGSVEDADSLLRQIERHKLSNPESNLRFVLLTGFPESDEQRCPEDAALLEKMAAGIANLNRSHGTDGDGPFHLFHRERSFNAIEGRWMGWERKRGKLDEFNRLLLGDDTTGFNFHEGSRPELEGVRFVITLDADTALPQGAAALLIATLAHPLNHAEVDPASGRVHAGYTVIQPRVEISPESGSRSFFTRLYCGDTAIDIYSRAVSDVYQDLFGTGIYIGKAIYDVAAFSRSLAGRAPENALASHDLFEGIHGRAALATDIVLYEDYPATYLAFARRLHRWVRGDWQLVPWLRRRVPGAPHDYLPNRFAWIDRWKIIDNLRRSLLPVATLLLIVSGWTWLPGHPLAWTLFAILAPAGHLFIDFATGLARERWRPTHELARSLSEGAGRWLFHFIFLPHQAAITADAIVRTLIRITFTKRHLLEWTTAAHADTAIARSHPVALSWREMALAPLIALVAGAAVLNWRPGALLYAAPFLVLWAVSPEIARRISLPTPAQREALSEDDAAFLRGVARRTWLFFETFVGPEGHWLPPDNYQEDPGRIIAHRTSPTNIGMLLTSTFAAYDLGFIGLEQLAMRLRHTLRTVARLEHYRGHLLNWYDTQTLEPLPPRYVSTVDSGNLAAALIATEAGCREMLEAPYLRPERWQGLADTIGLIQGNLAGLIDDGGASHFSESEMHLSKMHELAMSVQDEPSQWAPAIAPLEAACSEFEEMILDTIVNPGVSVDASALRDVRACLARVHEHIRGIQHEIESLAPWLHVLDAMPSLPEHHSSAPKLRGIRAELVDLLSPSTPLRWLSLRCDEASTAISEARENLRTGTPEDSAEFEIRAWLDDLDKAVTAGTGNARQLQADLSDLARQAEREALGMDFGLLYDARVRHFFIGYNVTADQMDGNHYDLLASEARLASLVAIAKGDVPAEHWFALERPLTRTGGAVAVLSWGGTMFEYLLPPLLMRSQPGTLLAESQRAAVLGQMEAAELHGLPWGVSESGFAEFDADHNYQYRAFGVQALGRKRGLDEDRVVAPYATALALPLFPLSAVRNLRRLQDLGMLGTYGFFEAIDFTASRLAKGRSQAIVSSHMAHHQGMILAAVVNLLCGEPLVRRFEANARIQAAALLLQERLPSRIPVEESPLSMPRAPRRRSERLVTLHSWRPATAGPRPSVHVLGNGRLTSRTSDSGAGSLSWRGHAVTRCVPDGTLDDTGLWVYVQDKKQGNTWSVGRQPTGAGDAELDVVFHAHMLELHRRQNGVAIRTDIAIGTGDDLEVRRITVVNETNQSRSISLTSYAEVVLAPARDDARHLAFSKLFVEATHVESLNALVFVRRPRNPDEHFPVVMHRLVADSKSVTFAGFETDRERFLGRNGNVRRPQGLEEGLSGSLGFTLDPIMAIGADVQLAPFATESLAFVTIAGPSRQAVDQAAARNTTVASFEWLLADAHAEAEQEAGRLGLEASRLPELQTLLSALLASRSNLRARDEHISDQPAGQQDLWGLGISGDHPILTVETENGDGELLADLIRAHKLWRVRGFAVDLVLLSTGATGYWDEGGTDVHRLLERLDAAEWLGRRAGIHLVRGDQISDAHRRLLTIEAGAILDADGAPLREQLTRHELAPRPLPRLNATRTPLELDATPTLQRPEDLQFDNGLGGFSPDGREYVIHLGAGETTPAPWCNVLANENFGCLVSETGGGYTWSGNSGEFRLTPWTNDAVLDSPAESLYLRDEETTEVWSPTPGPAGADLPSQVVHGAGYSEWRQNSHSLSCQVRVFVPIDDPVKIIELRVRNHENRPRRITATYYARWLLGRVVEDGASHVVTAYDAPTRSLRARNRWNTDFANQVAFLTADREPHGLTADRTEFFGREGEARIPDALRRVGLSGAVGVGLDPCAALQVHLDIPPDGEVRMHFVLGAGNSTEQAAELAQRWQSQSTVDDASKQLATHWDALLSAVTVRTPEPAMDLLINRWALYQVLSSRILGRTGFYQSSGAFGFRDQLQDVLALVHCDPSRTRAHLLECARHQFEEGDVLHWWHPPLGRGVRTRCSDDLLWLPYVTARYVEATGDLDVLEEQIPFLSAPPLGDEEHERYDLFEQTGETASLFEHCRRALERGLTRGPHGLPLIGDGDWNDGMNRVGSEGRGESVWLGWFGGACAEGFAALCERRGETELAKSLRDRAQSLFDVVNAEGWDGQWFRRAFDDEGTPWGSSTSEECQIDSIAQSWAVLSGGAPRERAAQALESAESALVSKKDRLACLLTPPFNLTARDPGYIKAYPPGIRENGGQYSHAAAWLGWAFAETGDGDRATEIFRILNPIEHTKTPEDVSRYRIEPYAIAADIASVEPHIGRGGWSWYTGAAAWSWRLGVEAILGLRQEGSAMRIDPQIPLDWPGFEATIRLGDGVLEIEVDNTQARDAHPIEILVDGLAIEGNLVDLPVNGATRRVKVRNGRSAEE